MASEYIINYSSDVLKDAFTILPRTVNNTTSLVLYGKGAPSYGEGLQEDLIHLLENFCSDTAPARPTIGQLWYHNSASVLSICTSITPDTWKVIGIQTSDIAPVGIEVGALWFDIGEGILNYWDGTKWVPLGSSSATGGIPPSGPKIGQLWVDTSIGVLKYWSGIQWISVGTNDEQTDYVAAIMLLLSPVRAGYLSTVTSNVQDQLDALFGDITNIQDQLELLDTCATAVAGKVSKIGDTMTGYLFLHADPLLNMQATTKRYVDLAIFNALKQIGGSNSSNQQHQIVVLATINAQTIFTLPTAPTAAHVVYVSGVEQSLTNYTLVGKILTLSVGVMSGTEIMIDYYDLNGSPNGVSAMHIQTQDTIANQTVLNITIPYIMGNNSLMVFCHGIKQQITNAYTETSTTSITFTVPLDVDTEITTISYALIGDAAIQKNSFIATAGQTVLPIVPIYHHTNNPSDPLNVDVMVHVAGVTQGLTEYTETNGSSIILSSGVAAGTPIEVYIFNIN